MASVCETCVEIEIEMHSGKVAIKILVFWQVSKSTVFGSSVREMVMVSVMV